ncbi:MAG: hypothetical protein PVI40_06960 [Chlamydiota bacterium]|jgi:hypothetical protein
MKVNNITTAYNSHPIDNKPLQEPRPFGLENMRELSEAEQQRLDIAESLLQEISIDSNHPLENINLTRLLVILESMLTGLNNRLSASEMHERSKLIDLIKTQIDSSKKSLDNKSYIAIAQGVGVFLGALVGSIPQLQQSQVYSRTITELSSISGKFGETHYDAQTTRLNQLLQLLQRELDQVDQRRGQRHSSENNSRQALQAGLSVERDGYKV